VAVSRQAIILPEPRHLMVMILSTDRSTENELRYRQFRVEQLEAIVRELLIKNEQLRMALYAERSVDVANAPRLG
jgi:hypothetical protein